MKKSIIVCLGLFTLVACSEDTYFETDKSTESGAVENSSGGIAPPTTSSGYNSPFDLPNVKSSGVKTTFKNNTPLVLELTPYGQDIHRQLFLSAHNIYPPYATGIITDLNPIPGASFNVMPGTVETNMDFNAPLAVHAPPYTSSGGSIIYDFGSWTPNFRMYHHGKIYYFEYKIFDQMGNVLANGYIKHNFYNDNETWQDIISDPDWELVGEVASLLPMHDVAVMYNTVWDEMCLTNKVGYAAAGYAPLPSSVDVVDPVTGVMHTLEFRSTGTGIYVDFN